MSIDFAPFCGLVFKKKRKKACLGAVRFLTGIYMVRMDRKRWENDENEGENPAAFCSDAVQCIFKRSLCFGTAGEA